MFAVVVEMKGRVKLLYLCNLYLNIEPFKSSRDDLNINTMVDQSENG